MTGAYYVSTTLGNTFDCVYYHSDSLQAVAGAVGRNLTRSTQLIIQKKSYVKTLSDAEQYARRNSSRYFIYDDKNFLIWDKADEGTSVDTSVTDPASFSATDYSPSPGFSTRGFPASESGNELRIQPIPIKPQNFKMITITPFGQVILGTTR